MIDAIYNLIRLPKRRRMVRLIHDSTHARLLPRHLRGPIRERLTR